MYNFFQKNKGEFGNKLASKRIILTLLIIFFLQLGKVLPLNGIDESGIQQLFLTNPNSILQLITTYSFGEESLISPFSLGISPFINASILIDLLTTVFPVLEKLQNEEGENGRQKIFFYKKIAATFFASIQGIYLLLYLKPYIYDTSIQNLGFLLLQLVTGTLIAVWFTTLIEKKGIGNGTSILICANLFIGLIKKFVNNFSLFTYKSIFEIVILILFSYFICILQKLKREIPIVSAKQLIFTEDLQNKPVKEQVRELSFLNDQGNTLSIKLNQAGIFPIIIVSNFFPFLSSLTKNFITLNNFFGISLYYILIISFNYFYTILFWDPEKIAEQLRKSSVSIQDRTPGTQTVNYLDNFVRSTSFLGGIYLCFLIFLYEIIKNIYGENILSQVNISSLIILVGITYDIHRKIKALGSSSGFFSHLKNKKLIS